MYAQPHRLPLPVGFVGQAHRRPPQAVLVGCARHLAKGEIFRQLGRPRRARRPDPGLNGRPRDRVDQTFEIGDGIVVSLLTNGCLGRLPPKTKWAQSNRNCSSQTVARRYQSPLERNQFTGSQPYKPSPGSASRDGRRSLVVEHIPGIRRVMDPQGDAVRRALTTQGFSGIGKVRVGKLIEIELEAQR